MIFFCWKNIDREKLLKVQKIIKIKKKKGHKMEMEKFSFSFLRNMKKNKKKNTEFDIIEKHSAC